MIGITCSCETFFEIENSNIIAIYGAANAGFWIGYYMDKCNIHYDMYIDRYAENRPMEEKALYYNKKPVFSKEHLLDFKNETVRIIISIEAYKEVIYELTLLDCSGDMDLICLIPEYEYSPLGKVGYDLNKLLSYFRRKLISVPMPTIISNDCTAGLIYSMLGERMISPTINTFIWPTEFVRFCKNLDRYLDMEMEIFYREKRYRIDAVNDDNPVGILDDVRVFFVHDHDDESCKNNWNKRRKRINPERILYLMTDNNHMVDMTTTEEFLSLPGEKYFIATRNMMGCVVNSNYTYINRYYFADRGYAIENYFDLLGWLNGSKSQK